MEDTITFDKFRFKYYKQVRHIVANAFQWKSLSTSKIHTELFSHLFVLGCLSLSNFSCIALVDKKPVGLSLGRSNQTFNQLFKFPLRSVYLLLMLMTTILVFPNKNGRQLLELETRLEKTSKKILQHYGKPLDGELTLLALDANHRGKGIGQSLLKAFKSFMKQHQSTSFQLYTETKISTFSFYEKQGLINIGQEHIQAPVGKQTFETKVILFKGVVE
jgi:ribosomal protein S18 acetylase RimI-like enzyme